MVDYSLEKEDQFNLNYISRNHIPTASTDDIDYKKEQQTERKKERGYLELTDNFDDDDDEEEVDEEEEDFFSIGSPIAIMWYEYLMNPQSSVSAMVWSYLLIALVFLRIICLLLESCDGPNQFYDRSIDRARYYFLLTEPQYFQLYCACMVPMLFDSIMRIVLVVLITFEPENYPIYKRFIADKTEIALFLMDVVCVIPFLVSAISLHPQDMLSLPQASSIFLSILELLMTGKIFRLVRFIPAVRAVSIALTNSFEHLVLPLFFFFAFNITTGVFFYFAEPCYNVDTCPWTSLFQTSFYSIVSMTTSKWFLLLFDVFSYCCFCLFLSLSCFVTFYF
jgi:hypothetical protein